MPGCGHTRCAWVLIERRRDGIKVVVEEVGVYVGGHGG